MFDCGEYHSEFQPLEVTRYTVLTDKMSLHFFELLKLPSEINADNLLLLWLSLFKAETEDELERIKLLEVPVMKEAINAYHRITATPEFREIERLRSKARHDEAQALHHAREQGMQQEREKWQTVVADKDAQIAELQTQLEKRTT